MKIVQPIELVTLSLAFVAPIVTWFLQYGVVISLLVLTCLLLVTLILISYRIVSYIIAFLVEMAPSVAVIKDFMRRLS